VFSFELKRNPNWKEMEKNIKLQEKGLLSFTANSELNIRNNVTSNQTQADLFDEFQPLRELTNVTYSKRYKQLFHQYQYVPKYKKLKKANRKAVNETTDE
jgi:hypothetical protein